MEFALAGQQPKLVMLMYGLIAIRRVVGGCSCSSTWCRSSSPSCAVHLSPPAGAPPAGSSGRWRSCVVFLGPALLLLVVGLVVPADPDDRAELPERRRQRRSSGSTNYNWAFTDADDLTTSCSTPLLWISSRRSWPPGSACSRAAGRPAAPRVDPQVADLHADGDLVRRRQHHLEVRLRLPRPVAAADRPAQPGRDLARLRRPAELAARPAAEQLPAHGHHDLGADRLRHGGALGRDQGDPGRRHRGGPDGRRAAAGCCSAGHHPDDPQHADRRADDGHDHHAEDLRHRPDHDRRQLRHPGAGQRDVQPVVRPVQHRAAAARSR